MREIVLDTETTGLDPASGHRLVEIAGIELVNFIPTGRHYHVYINPNRDMPEDAFKIHGLSGEFLAGQKPFAQLVEDFAAFVEGAKLVIHNAEFDMKFINHELRLVGRSIISMDGVIDTLALARRKHPGQSNSLDALCQRYKIDNSKRVKHGALIDAEILAEVYAELLGGRQTSLGLGARVVSMRREGWTETRQQRPSPLPEVITEAERAAHAAFVSTLGPNALWLSYPDKPAETGAA